MFLYQHPVLNTHLLHKNPHTHNGKAAPWEISFSFSSIQAQVAWRQYQGAFLTMFNQPSLFLPTCHLSTILYGTAYLLLTCTVCMRTARVFLPPIIYTAPPRFNEICIGVDTYMRLQKRGTVGGSLKGYFLFFSFI
ncbi:hypothetical protein IQ07DRAFT_237982 [Pyrenochaeta sp. DS3sAY3a]|nr:hypothetical protein IQ07DRAFT_237982 [Pyrenochaeta sp. DS3sAY3a]